MESIVCIETLTQLLGTNTGPSYMDDEDQNMMMADMTNTSAQESTSSISNNNNNNGEPKEKIIRQMSGVSWMM